MKKRLLYLITRSDIGGAQTHVIDLVKGFCTDYEVHLATSSEGPLTEAVKNLSVSVHLLPSLTRSINLFNDFQALRDTQALIRKIQPNLIHAHSSKAGLIGRISGSLCKVPAVFTAHGWGFAPRTPVFRRIIALVSEKLSASLAEKLICVAESDCQLAMQYGVANRSKLVTVRYGISNSAVPLANPLIQPPRLIMVARFNEQKDQTTLIKALSRLKTNDIHLDFVGSGPSMESCRDLAESLEVADKISFLGDRRDVADLLARSQIFVLSTHYEGLPISILEAMRSGLPVVATSVSGIPEEVIHGETGLLVPPGDEQALASALETLIDSPELRQRMGEAGRQKFLQEFTIERMISQIESVYKQILDKSQ